MGRILGGVFLLGIGLLLGGLGLARTVEAPRNQAYVPDDRGDWFVDLAGPAAVAGCGLGLICWGVSGVSQKKRLRQLEAVFHHAPLSGAATSGEQTIATLIADETEKRYYQRGQVAAVTDRRLLFLRPRAAFGSRSLESHYSVESIDIAEITEVRHKKAFAVGPMVVGLVMIGIAVAVAWAGLTVRLIGPGVVFIPLMTAPLGLALTFGVRRRTIAFATKYGELRWRSGPMQIRKTSPQVQQVCEFFLARQIPVRGFDNLPDAATRRA